jgi:hypothetical protein
MRRFVSQAMSAIFADVASAELAAFHDAAVRAPADIPPAHADEAGVWFWIERNQRCNRMLWDQEDEARRTDAPDSAIAANKRAIDAQNQRRNDAVERIDEILLARLAAVNRGPDPWLNSETAGSIIDRLSILALKIHHMRAQTLRTDATGEHVEGCRAKLARLVVQRRDLSGCLDALLERATQGRAYWHVYRQFKMYNDPALNPWLYGAKR